MEQLFGTQLNGIFKDAHEFATKELNLNPEEAEAMGEVTKGIQLVVELATLPMQMELDKAKNELAVMVETNKELYQGIKERNEYIHKLEIENRNLVSSLKYLKEVSEKQDLVNENVIYLNNYRK